jgi:hypothetical protein
MAEKVCPDCAETVLEAAALCRFCGHRFESNPLRSNSPAGGGMRVAALVLLMIFGVALMWFGYETENDALAMVGKLLFYGTAVGVLALIVLKVVLLARARLTR